MIDSSTIDVATGRVEIAPPGKSPDAFWLQSEPKRPSGEEKRQRSVRLLSVGASLMPDPTVVIIDLGPRGGLEFLQFFLRDRFMQDSGWDLIV
jgi:hypothetical protein